jgi:hypothetical protein
MSPTCELLNNCGFFRKYKSTKNSECQSFIAMYCGGFKMRECKRREYRKSHGKLPSDDMMPTGQMLVEINKAE